MPAKSTNLTAASSASKQTKAPAPQVTAKPARPSSTQAKASAPPAGSTASGSSSPLSKKYGACSLADPVCVGYGQCYCATASGRYGSPCPEFGNCFGGCCATTGYCPNYMAIIKTMTKVVADTCTDWGLANKGELFEGPNRITLSGSVNASVTATSRPSGAGTRALKSVEGAVDLLQLASHTITTIDPFSFQLHSQMTPTASRSLLQTEAVDKVSAQGDNTEPASSSPQDDVAPMQTSIPAMWALTTIVQPAASPPAQLQPPATSQPSQQSARTVTSSTSTDRSSSSSKTPSLKVQAPTKSPASVSSSSSSGELTAPPYKALKQMLQCVIPRERLCNTKQKGTRCMGYTVCRPAVKCDSRLTGAMCVFRNDASGDFDVCSCRPVYASVALSAADEL